MGNLCGGNPDAARVAKIPCGLKVGSENTSQKSPNRAFKLGPEAVKELRSALPAETKQRTSWARNTIKTSKYEWYNFVFLSLREQFQRTANYFFLGMCVLMLIGTYTNLFQSALNPWSTLGSVLIVMTFTMVLQAWDDYGRHKNDHEINIRKAETVDGDLQWQDVKVGQIVIVKNQESFPADLILLCSSEVDGLSYVETSNIDGETNLKIRSSPSEDLVSMIQNPGQIDDLNTAIQNVKKLDATLDYLKPDPKVSLEHFEGVLRGVKYGGVSISKPRVSLDKNHHMLRGATLRNTKWILGVVVYTGEETKLALNSSKNRGKLSNMEKVVNRLLYTVFAVMFVMVTVTDVGMLIWRSRNFGSNIEGWWYLFPDGQDEGYDLPIWIAQWFTIAILYTNFVPLSMYVTMEFINFWHAKFINEDLEMYDEETDTCAHTRSFNLCAELGQVEYIFSDKTGTLTQNKMEFKMCSIGNGMSNKIYGKLETKHFQDPEVFSMIEKMKDKSVKLSDHEDLVRHFFFGMAINHTVVAEKDEKMPFGVSYQAESPDEGALVDSAAMIGWRFLRRSARTITVRLPSGEERDFVILALNKFNSTRKRSSTVVKDTVSNKIYLYCKGADNKMIERASVAASKLKRLDKDLSVFSKKGLRTLVFGMREISKSEFDTWITEYDKANTATSKKKEKRMAAAEKIEKKMILLGASAIEDKLQDNVPDTIADIRKAGVKIWVLTGDKMETAINIGYSCKLLVHENMKVLKMKVEENDSDEIVKKRKMLETADKKSFNFIKAELDELVGAQREERRADVARALHEMLSHISAREGVSLSSDSSNDDDDDDDKEAKVESKDSERIKLPPIADMDTLGSDSESEDDIFSSDDVSAVTNDFSGLKTYDAQVESLALVITGSTIEIIMADPMMTRALLRVGMACAVVVACRVSPAQKALMVKMVREGIQPTPVTLAIGDGANDVEMIKEAQVGVGISGREGLQAANSADFSIAQFRFLKRLLFIHGRWNYRRMSKVILFSFYKNIVLVLTLFYYQFLTGFSGTSLYEDYLQSMFNVFLFLSPVMIGLFDKDVPAKIVDEFPELYQSGLCQLDLNQYTMIETVVLALFNSFIVFGFPALAFNSMNDGVNNGVYTIGTLVFTCLIVTMEYRCLFITVTWNKYIHWGWLGTVFVYLLFLFLYGGVICLSLGPFFYHVPMHLFARPVFWMVIVGVPMTAITFDLIAAYVKREFFPNFVDLCAELAIGYIGESAEHQNYLDRVRNASISKISAAIKSVVQGAVDSKQEKKRVKVTKSTTSGQSRRRSSGDGYTGVVTTSDSSEYSGSASTAKHRRQVSKNMTVEDLEDMTRLSNHLKPKLPALGVKKSCLDVSHNHRHTASVFDMPTLESLKEGEDDERDGIVLKTITTQMLDLSTLTPMNSGAPRTRAPSSPSSKHRDDENTTDVSIKIDSKKEHKRRKSSISTNSERDISENKNRPVYSDLYQQTVLSRQVVITPTHTRYLLIMVATVTFILGGVLYTADSDVTEYQIQYGGPSKEDPRDKNSFFSTWSTDCYSKNFTGNDTKCEITFYIGEDMEPPIFVNYRLTRFYQNYQSYFLSRDGWELQGRPEDGAGCPGEPRMGVTLTRTCDNENTLFENGIQTNTCKILKPCGRAAYSYFSDRFTVKHKQNCTCSSAPSRDIPSTFNCNNCNVATDVSVNDVSLDLWDSDRDFYGELPRDDPADYQYIEDRFPELSAEKLKDPHFMIWMRLAALPDFMKRYGVINQRLRRHDQLTFEVDNTFPVDSFDGQKFLILITHSWRGPAKDAGLAWMFFVTGMMSVFFFMGITLQQCFCPRKMGQNFVKQQTQSGAHTQVVRDRQLSGVSEYDSDLNTVVSGLKEKETTFRRRASLSNTNSAELELTSTTPSSPIATAVKSVSSS